MGFTTRADIHSHGGPGSGPIRRVFEVVISGCPEVDDVPDNRRPGRHRMVGTRTTDRDWQWLDEMLGYEAAAPRRVRRMPEDGERRGGRGGGHRGGRGGGRRGGRGGGRVPSSQPHGGASSSHQAGPSQQSEVPATPQHHFDSSTPVFGSPSQDFMVGLNSPGFQRTLQQLMVDDTRYRPRFDGSRVQVHMDLNEPASAPCHLFTVYAGTPASGYMQDAHFMDPYPIPPQAPKDPLANDTCGDEGGAPMGRGRRVPRCRDCGTRGHM
ncbi:hypothetical protein PIB30_056600 [Stylosanthes scabra]|uniref:Uncharacterized protein n=1 Tax=Stylosanthes scabra TaxID=79078 RepID=A0ABU6VHX9_9FABA|nr:hypothetical protein [Stylosanthes scabra]